MNFKEEKKNDPPENKNLIKLKSSIWWCIIITHLGLCFYMKCTEYPQNAD